MGLLKLFARLTLSLTALLALVVTPALAVGYGGVGGRPANPDPKNPRSKSIFVYELKPGQSKQDGVRIFNNTKKRRTIEVGAVDSILASGGAFSCEQNSAPKNSVGNWITLAQNQVNVDSFKNKVVNFTVSVPPNASVGEHNGCITIQDQSMTAQENSGGVILGFRSAIRVAITVPGKIVKNLQLVGVGLSGPTDGIYHVMPTAKNTGNVSLDTVVAASLSPIVGQSTKAASGTYPVLPGSTASWNLKVKRPYWGGFYRAQASITYNDDTNRTLGQNGGATKTLTNYSSAVFIMPQPLALATELVAICLIVLLILWLLRFILASRQVKTRWQGYTVQPSDTIAKVAKAHHVSWKQLAKHNRVKPPYHLEVGTTIKVPPISKRG